MHIGEELALGIAAAVTVFGCVNAAFLRPLPVPTGDRLVRVQFDGRRGGDDEQIGLHSARYLRAHARSLDLVAAHYSTAPFHVGTEGESQAINGAVVSADYFRMLGLRPGVGRFFTADEDAVPDRDPVAVIGDALWRARFAGDPAVLGRSITINGRPFRIVGVAPPGFAGVLPGDRPNEMWTPASPCACGATPAPPSPCSGAPLPPRTRRCR